MRRAALALSTTLVAASALTLGAARAQDRYGSQGLTGLTPVSYTSGQPLLTWPGKRPAPTDESAAPQPPAALPAPESIYPPPPEPALPPVRRAPPPPIVQAAPPPAPVSIYVPAPRPPAPKPPIATANLDMRPLLPASPPKPAHVAAVPPATAQVVHAAAPKPSKPAPNPPVKVATAAPATQPDAPHRPWSPTGPGGMPAHFYSTAREFGLKPDPDPAPLPAQFFTDPSGGDLAAPPPPLDPHPVPGSQTVGSTATANTASNRARAIALDTPSPDGSNN